MLDLKSRTTNALTVKWNYDKDRSIVGKWQIQYTEKNKVNWKNVAEVDSSIEERTITGLTSGAHYSIRVYAISRGKTSETATSVDAIVGESIFSVPFTTSCCIISSVHRFI